MKKKKPRTKCDLFDGEGRCNRPWVNLCEQYIKGRGWRLVKLCEKHVGEFRRFQHKQNVKWMDEHIFPRFDRKGCHEFQLQSAIAESIPPPPKKPPAIASHDVDCNCAGCVEFWGVKSVAKRKGVRR